MKFLLKTGAVLAGYAAAFLLASTVVAVHIENTSGPDAQASSGMYAFGDSLLFFAVFGVAALVPTGLAFYFLRSNHGFWSALSTTGLVLACTGLAALMAFILVPRWAAPDSPLQMWAAFAVLRLLAAPMLAGSLALSALAAPTASARWKLLAAAGMEGIASLFTVLHWFAPLFLPWKP